MKEIMMQYGHSVIAAVIAILLLVIICGTAGDKSAGIYAKTGQIVKESSLITAGSAEFERYWRLR